MTVDDENFDWTPVFDAYGVDEVSHVTSLAADAPEVDEAVRCAETETLDLLVPFRDGSSRGPDLRRPRPLLRIVPGKCSGEPHLLGTRLTTIAIRALVERGYDLDGVAELDPREDPEAIREAADLERQIALASAA